VGVPESARADAEQMRTVAAARSTARSAARRMDIVTSCRSWADATGATLALSILTIKMALSGVAGEVVSDLR
jgi:hypothetical protein